MRFEGKNLKGNFRKICLVIADIVLFAFSNILICYIVDGGNIFTSDYKEVLFNPFHLIILSAGVVVINYLCRLYQSVWSFAGTWEAVTCAYACIADAALLFMVDKLIFNLIFNHSILPFYAYMINYIFLFFSAITPRFVYRIIRSGLRNQYALSHSEKRNVKRVLIAGAGYMGNAIIDDLRKNSLHKSIPVAAVDDNPTKKGKRINGVKIVGNVSEIPAIADKYDIDEIILCMPSAGQKRINEILNLAMTTGKTVKIAPSLQEILENNDLRKRARKIEITDLLSRDEVKLDIAVCKYLIGTTILVTGGGGSIGSEICNQCARYNPRTIVIFDIYENCAFELANDLKAKYGDKINIHVRIGSVRDPRRLEEVFEEFKPDVVFHAAAHKHVPLMEDSPCEAVKNNVFGTYNVAVTANKFKVPKMVILSTDKAVNPTNVMGATKRITEIIVQYMNNKSDNTQYAAVRFGNVLGSHGSVIPIFKKQIEAGGPVCVTHPDITRYFMTIPEAAQLVCQAGGLAKGGEIFVLDMGEPVKIMDLAENLIKLSGYTVDEIGIKITGLRPGEKLYEELSLDLEMETRQKTANEKIFVNQPIVMNDKQFEVMLENLNDVNAENVREKLMAIVPNFHPANNG